MIPIRAMLSGPSLRAFAAAAAVGWGTSTATKLVADASEQLAGVTADVEHARLVLADLDQKITARRRELGAMLQLAVDAPEIVYTGYFEHARGLSVHDEALPGWEGMPSGLKKHWDAGVDALLCRAREIVG